MVNDRPGDCVRQSPSWDTCDRGCNWPECGCVLGDDGDMQPMPQGARETECEECEYTYGTHAPQCSLNPDREPSDPDGECHRGGEYASELAESQAWIQRNLK